MSWWKRFRGDIDRTESKAAVAESAASLEAAKARHREVRALVSSLEDQGQRNHFIERLNLHVRGANGH